MHIVQQVGVYGDTGDDTGKDIEINAEIECHDLDAGVWFEIKDMDHVQSLGLVRVDRAEALAWAKAIVRLLEGPAP